MKRITPLLTLLTGLLVGATLLVMSASAAQLPAAPPDAGGTAAAAPADPVEPTGQPPAGGDEADVGADDQADEADDGQAGEDRAGDEADDGPAKKATATWAGRVDGGRATIAITARNGVAIAYLCDGKKVEVWLKGTAADGELKLRGAGDAELTGTFGNGKATGEVSVGQRRWTFTARAVQKPSGVYRATAEVRNARVDAGWIVLADGTQVGVLTVDGSPEPAPALDLAAGRPTATVDGAVVVAAPATPAGDGDRETRW